MTELKYWENPYIIKENKEDNSNIYFHTFQTFFR